MQKSRIVVCFLFIAVWLAQASLAFGLSGQDVYLSAQEKAWAAYALKAYTQYAREVNPAELGKIKNSLEQIRQAEAREIQVSSFEEFLKAYRGDQVFQESGLNSITEAELRELSRPARFVSASPRVQRQIEQYLQEAATLKQNLALGAASTLTQGLFELSGDQNLSRVIEARIESKAAELTSELSASGSHHVRMLSKLLKMYFRFVPDSQKAEMLYKALELPLSAKPMDLFLVMIQNSGPQMQKLVQIIGRHQEIPESYKQVFQKLESQVQKVPWREVEKVLVAEGVDISGYSYFERKPIGVGTMAQTHRAQYINDEGERVSRVIRFLKPGIENKVQMDHEILLQIADEIDRDPELKDLRIPSLKKVVSDLNESVAEELKVEETVRNQQRASEVYNARDWVTYSRQNNEIAFHVPEVRLIGSRGNVMEQELVFGKKVSSEARTYQEVYPDLYKAIAEKIAQHWFEQVMFKSGFFHADLHQGNLLVQLSDREIKVNILDFGMVGQLTESQRESALLLALALKLGHADLIAKHLNALSDAPMQGSAYEQFKNRVRERVRETAGVLNSFENSMEAWVVWSLEKGISLSYEFLKLNRGLTAIKTMLTDSGSEMDIHRIAEKVALRNKMKLTGILVKENLLRLADYAALAGFGVRSAGTAVRPADRAETRQNTNGLVRLRCEAIFAN